MATPRDLASFIFDCPQRLLGGTEECDDGESDEDIIMSRWFLDSETPGDTLISVNDRFENAWTLSGYTLPPDDSAKSTNMQVCFESTENVVSDLATTLDYTEVLGAGLWTDSSHFHAATYLPEVSLISEKHHGKHGGQPFPLLEFASLSLDDDAAPVNVGLTATSWKDEFLASQTSSHKTPHPWAGQLSRYEAHCAPTNSHLHSGPSFRALTADDIQAGTHNGRGEWHEQYPRPVQDCTATPSGRDSLAYHVRTSHGEQQEQYRCSIQGCPTVCQGDFSLKQHMRKHAPRVPCPHCKRNGRAVDFRSEEKLVLDHIRLSHPNEYETAHATYVKRKHKSTPTSKNYLSGLLAIGAVAAGIQGLRTFVDEPVPARVCDVSLGSSRIDEDPETLHCAPEKRKAKILADTDDSGGGGANGRGGGNSTQAQSQKRPRAIAAESREDEKKFACPFFAHDPVKYSKNRTCAMPDHATVHRIKEHVYRIHKCVIHCTRCSEVFETDSLLLEHSQLETACELLKPPRKFDGITPKQREDLRCRKDAPSSEEAKWQKMYKIIFPGVKIEDIPSPYHDAALALHAARSKLFKIDALTKYFSEQVPREIERQFGGNLASLLNGSDVELRDKLPQVICEVGLSIIESYASLASDQQSSADNGTVDESAEIAQNNIENFDAISMGQGEADLQPAKAILTEFMAPFPNPEDDPLLDLNWSGDVNATAIATYGPADNDADGLNDPWQTDNTYSWDEFGGLPPLLP